MSVVYTTINGMIVHENRGGVESFYAPDTMGSTVALLNSSGVVTDTYTYWPYGEIRSHVGSSQTPFTFLGMIGYYTDVVGNFIYVRARYLRQTLTRWQTVDPLWPSQRPYTYVEDAPASISDGSGMGSLDICTGYPWWVAICMAIKKFCAGLKICFGLLALIGLLVSCAVAGRHGSVAQCRQCYEDFLNALAAIAGLVNFAAGVVLAIITQIVGQETADSVCNDGPSELPPGYLPPHNTAPVNPCYYKCLGRCFGSSRDPYSCPSQCTKECGGATGTRCKMPLKFP